MNRTSVPTEAAPVSERMPAAGRNGSLPPGGPSVQVVHAAVPGRTRLFVPGLKRNTEGARRLETAASTWPGIRRASASPATGNLLLEYDPHQAATDELVARVEAMRPQPAGVMAGGRATGRAARSGAERTSAARSAGDGAGAYRGAAPTDGETPNPASLPAELLAALETAPLPPPPPPRTRAMEVALGGAALLGAGAMLLAVRAYGHELALDQTPLALAQEMHSPALTAFMRGASRLVEPSILWPVTLGATLLGVGRQAPGDFPWLAPVTVGGGVTLISILKVLLRRARPAAFEHLVSARGYSLPSGHAFLAASLYGLLAHHGFRWLRARRPDDRSAAAALVLISTAAILLVGISRVYLGVHYPTDVIAGYALALVWLFFLAAINDRSRPAPAIGGV